MSSEAEKNNNSGNSSNPRSQSDFFPFAIHIVYAIVLGASFEVAKEIFVPINNVFESLQSFSNGFAIFVTYFILIAGWLSYTLAINKIPHKPTGLGTLRFGIDLLIMTILFYLVSIGDKDSFEKAYWHAFVWVLPFLFGVYCIWDYVSLKEYETDERLKLAIKSQGIKSARAFFMMLIQSLFFGLIWTIITILPNPPINFSELVLLFSISTLLITLYYRITGWNIDQIKPNSIRERRV